MKYKITRDDIMPIDQYAGLRGGRRKAMSELKKNRRIHVGPDATFYFESYETMWHQIHEMLYIEGGGDDQLADELNAYNPLIPNGKELVATLMFEVDDATRRAALLGKLGGVEGHVFMFVGATKIQARPEMDVDRTTPGGKASAVQFVHFPFTAVQITLFCSGEGMISLGIDHPEYGHVAIVSDAVRKTLARDFS